MSQTSKERQYEGALVEQVVETEQTDESSVVQEAIQSKEPRRSERARTLTEKGKEF